MRFRRFLSAVMSAVMIISCLAIDAGAAKSVQSAHEAAAAIGAGWNLGNALDSNGEWIKLYTPGRTSDYETAWGNPVTTKKTITAVKNAGFNAVRVPVTWYQHIDGKGNIDKAWLDRVQEVVDYVISQDMYCVLNVHHDGGTDGWLVASEADYRKNADKFAALWTNIAERFKSYGEKLIFESFNEMLDTKDSWTESRDSGAYAAINSYNQLFVDTVRKTGGNNPQRNLMVQTYSGASSEKTLRSFVLPKDSVSDHLMVQVHNYDPAGFTTKNVTWTAPTTKWGSDKDKQEFDKLFERLGKYSAKWDAPVIVGEYGADYQDNDSDRAVYASYFVSKAAEYGIRCFWWDTGDMALINRSAGKVTHPAVTDAIVTAAKTQTVKDNKPSEKPSKKLAAPTVKASVSENRIKLTWDKVDGADAYRVYQLDSKTGKYVKIATVKGTTYNVKPLGKGTYSFKVMALEKNGSAYTNGTLSKTVKASVKA